MNIAVSGFNVSGTWLGIHIDQMYQKWSQIQAKLFLCRGPGHFEKNSLSDITVPLRVKCVRNMLWH